MSGRCREWLKVENNALMVCLNGTICVCQDNKEPKKANFFGRLQIQTCLMLQAVAGEGLLTVLNEQRLNTTCTPEMGYQFLRRRLPDQRIRTEYGKRKLIAYYMDLLEDFG